MNGNCCYEWLMCHNLFWMSWNDFLINLFVLFIMDEWIIEFLLLIIINSSKNIWSEHFFLVVVDWFQFILINKKKNILNQNLLYIKLNSVLGLILFLPVNKYIYKKMLLRHLREGRKVKKVVLKVKQWDK